MDFETRISYPIAAILVLLAFYGVYFIKMFAQKRKGIRTRQIGKKREKRTRMVETVMSVATLSVVAVQGISILCGWSSLPSGARFTGLCVGVIGDFIFLISVCTMKDSWRAGIPERDQTAFVTDGIYRYSRNPAFLGFDFMYFGILLMFFNPLLFAFTLFAMISLHFQILEEEKYLKARFGAVYRDYKKRVFRYLGRK